MSWEVIWQILGVSSTALTVAFLFAICRHLLKHSVLLWASRTRFEPWNQANADGPWIGQDECRFAIQNLEPVPIDREMRISIIEEGIPAAWREKAIFEGPFAIRVYSGRAKPTFLNMRSPLGGAGNEALCTELKFGPMPANDTWTLKVRTNARSVRIKLIPAGVPLKPMNPLKPWLAVTLSSAELEIRSGTNVPVRNGPTDLPTWSTGVAVAAIGPILYLVGMFVLWSFDSKTVAELDWFPWFDAAIFVVLCLFGWLWYRWVRRSVYPTIQSYHTFYWAADGNRHAAGDEERNPTFVR